MSAVEADVNPSDIGTEALGRLRLSRMRTMLGFDTELTDTYLFTWKLARRISGGSGQHDELQVDDMLSRHVERSTEFGSVWKASCFVS